ncbi:MAG: mechanosensitive ion channel family protein, partial [Cyclobacteriaceae bacterium]
RNKAEIIGSVFFHLDYSAPVDKIRGQLTKILENEPLWDKKVNVLHVVDATEKTIQLRALMSAKTSPQAWDLRCSVREKLITYVRENHPECLPLHRIKTQT